MNYPKRIVALDLETTGKVALYDYVVQIAAAIMEDGKVIGEPFYSRMRPDMEKMKVSFGALSAHCGDLTKEEGQDKAKVWFKEQIDAPGGLEVATSFAVWCRENQAIAYPVVAHNASFDHGFMREKILCFKSQFKTPPLSPMWIDTLEMAKQAWPTARVYGLDACLISADLPRRPDHHDALMDALLAGRLYHHMIQMLSAERA